MENRENGAMNGERSEGENPKNAGSLVQAGKRMEYNGDSRTRGGEGEEEK